MKTEIEIAEKIYILQKEIEKNKIMLKNDITEGQRILCQKSIEEFTTMLDCFKWVIL